jgi:hypothetical protein
LLALSLNKCYGVYLCERPSHETKDEKVKASPAIAECAKHLLYAAAIRGQMADSQSGTGGVQIDDGSVATETNQGIDGPTGLDNMANESALENGTAASRDINTGTVVDPDIRRQGLDDKIQKFYLALRASDQITELIESLNAIEDHQPISALGETAELLNEFITDCQKKSAQVIRAPYAEAVRNSIAAYRKRLASKIAKEVDTSQQHGQRHLNTIIELLGNFSAYLKMTG